MALLLALMPVFYSQAQSEELKIAKEQLKTNYGKLIEIKNNKELSDQEKAVRELEIKKLILKAVIEYSIVETKDLIAKLSLIKDIPIEYIELQENYLKTLEEFLNNQAGYLENLDNFKETANDFKIWRDNIYNPLMRKVLDFILIFRSSDILIIAQNRFEKINKNLDLLKDSKIINVSTLQPVLEEARNSLDEAISFRQEASRILLVASVEGSKVKDSEVENLIKKMIDKIKEMYNKFLEMSDLIKKMTVQ